MVRKRGYIEQRGLNSWRIQYIDAAGARHRESVKGTLEDAERELTIRLGEIAKGLPVSSRPNTVLFEELAADVLNDYEVNGYSSFSDIDARFRLHILPMLGKRRASQITTALLNAYIVRRQSETPRPAVGTINRELEAIRHTFKLAVQGRKLFNMPHVPHLREDNVRTGFFTREEVDRLCSFLEEPYRSFVLFGFLTGWRYDEIRSLQWRQVDFVRNEIRLDVGSTKNREGRVFPMTGELRNILSARTPTRPTHEQCVLVANQVMAKQMPAITPYVFSTKEGRQVGQFRKSWKTACHRAGLPCVVAPVKKGGKRGAVKVIKALRTFHDLRRSFARDMDLQGVRHGAIKRLGGWKTDSVFNRYNIVSDADLRDAIEKVDTNHANPPAKAKKSSQ